MQRHFNPPLPVWHARVLIEKQRCWYILFCRNRPQNDFILYKYCMASSVTVHIVNMRKILLPEAKPRLIVFTRMLTICTVTLPRLIVFTRILTICTVTQNYTFIMPPESPIWWASSFCWPCDLHLACLSLCLSVPKCLTLRPWPGLSVSLSVRKSLTLITTFEP